MSTLQDKQQWLVDLQIMRQSEISDVSTIQRAFNEYLYDNLINIGGQNSFNSFATSDILYLMGTHRMASLVLAFKFSSPYTSNYERISCNDASKSWDIFHGFISLKQESSGYQITNNCSGHIWISAKCSSSALKLCVDCHDPCSYDNILEDSVFPYPCGAAGGCIHSLLATFTDLYPAATILQINASEITRNSVNISVVTKDNVAPIYCVALLDSVQLSSALTILQGQMINSVGETLMKTSRRFGNLIPSSKYRVYCTTLSYSGSVLPLSVVLYQSIAVETLCCKTVSVKLINRFVFPGQSYFNAVLLSLSSIPSGSLKVIVSTSQDGLAFSPQNVLFSSSSISATGSFYLSLYCSLGLNSGAYDLLISLQGTSANEYSVYYATSNVINVIDSTFVGPPPSFSYAIMDALGRGVLVGLSDSTNKDLLFDSFSCGKLLNFTGVENAMCSWSDSFTVKISLPTTCSLAVGSVITWSSMDTLTVLQPTNVRLPSWPSNSRSDSITIQRSSIVIIPSVIVIGPEYITSCMDLVIDLSSTSGSGGREWEKVSVTITAATGKHTFAMTNYVKNQISNSSTHVFVPQWLIDTSSSYSFYFNYCNWLGLCGSSSYQVTVTNISFSSVSILGPKIRSMNVYESLTLYSRISPSSCGNSTPSSELLITWSAYRNGVQLPTIINQSNDSNIFYVESYSFLPGESYEIGLIVHDSKNSITTTSKISLDVSAAKSSDLVAIISQGSEISVPVGQLFSLDASFSYDRSSSPSRRSSDGQLQYQWSCSITPCDVELTPNGKELQLLAKAIPLSQIVQIQLTISKNSFYATAYIRLNFKFASAACAITIPPVIQGVNIAKKFSLLGSGTTFGPVSLTWSLDNNLGLNLSTISMGTTQLRINDTAEFTFPLAIAAFSLPYSSSLIFQLACVNSNTLISSYAKMIVTTNSPPLYGLIRVDPNRGVEMTTLFLMEAKYWVSSELPLKYEFSFLSSRNNNLLPIGGMSEAAFVYSTLPQGNYYDRYSLLCSLLVLDVIGCSANASTVVTVMKSKLGTRTNISAAPDVKNTYSMTQFLSIESSLLNLVNCSASPNCESLNRAPCLSLSHTCGECLPGYAGQLGSANSVCILSLSLASTSRRLALSVSKRCNVTHQSAQCGPYEVCSKGTCQPGIRTCSLSCSGRGSCLWKNFYSGATMSKCMLSDFSCIASCLCTNGYFGSSCEYSSAQIQSRISRRCYLITSFYEYLPYCNIDYNTVTDLVSILSTIIQNPEEISENCTRIAMMTVNALSAYSQSVGLPFDTTEQLTSSIDTIAAAILRHLGDHQSLLSEIMPVIQNFSVALSSDMIISQKKSIIGNLFRMDIAVFLLTDTVQLSEPLLEIEQLTNQHVSQQYSYNPRGSLFHLQNIWISTSFVVFEGAIAGRAKYLSSPLALITNFWSSPTALSLFYGTSVAASTQNNRALNTSHVHVPTPLSTKCYNNDFKSVTQYCPAGLQNSTASCRGRDEELINFCPTYHYKPRCNVFGSLPKSQAFMCTLQFYSSIQSQCICNAVGHIAINESYYLLLSTSVVTVMNSNATHIYAVFSSKSTSQLSSASLGVLIVCIVLMMISIIVTWKKRSEISLVSSGEKEKTDWYHSTIDLQRSWQKMAAADVFSVLNNHLQQVVPRIYVQKITMVSVLKETLQNHSFCGLLISSKVSPILKFWRVSTEVTAALVFTYIAVIVLYNPADQQLCKAMSTAKSCLAAKSSFTYTLSICTWDYRSASCEEDIATNDALLLLVLSFIVQLIMIPVSAFIMAVARRHTDSSEGTLILKRTTQSGTIGTDGLKFGAIKDMSSLDESKYENDPAYTSLNLREMTPNDEDFSHSLLFFKNGKVAPLGKAESGQLDTEKLTVLSHNELNVLKGFSKSMRDNRLIYIFICDLLSVIGGVNIFQAKVERDNGIDRSSFPTMSVIVAVSAIDIALIVVVFRQISLLPDQAQVLWAFSFFTWLSIDTVIFYPCLLFITDVCIPLTALEKLKKVTLYLQRTAQAYLALRLNPAKRFSTPLKSRMSALLMMSVKVARLCSNSGHGSIVSDLLQSFTGLEALMKKQHVEDGSSSGINRLFRVFMRGMEMLCGSALALDSIIYLTITIIVWGSVILWTVVAVSNASVTIVILIVALALFIAIVAVYLGSITTIDLEKLFPRQLHDTTDLSDPVIISAPKLDPLSRNFAAEWAEIERLNTYRKVKSQKQKITQSGLLPSHTDNFDEDINTQSVLAQQVSDEEKDVFDADKLADTGVKANVPKTIRFFNKRFKSFYSKSTAKVASIPIDSISHTGDDIIVSPVERVNTAEIEMDASPSQLSLGVPRVLVNKAVRTSKWRSANKDSPQHRLRNMGLASIPDNNSQSSGDTEANADDDIENVDTDDDDEKGVTLQHGQVKVEVGQHEGVPLPAEEPSIQVPPVQEALKINEGDLDEEGSSDDEMQLSVKKVTFINKQSRLRSASIRTSVRGRANVLTPSKSAIIAFENTVPSLGQTKEDELRRAKAMNDEENEISSNVETTTINTPAKAEGDGTNKMWARTSMNSIRTPYSIRRQQTVLRVTSRATEGSSRNLIVGRKSISPSPNSAALMAKSGHTAPTHTRPDAPTLSLVDIEDTADIKEESQVTAGAATHSSDSSVADSAADDSSDKEF